MTNKIEAPRPSPVKYTPLYILTEETIEQDQNIQFIKDYSTYKLGDQMMSRVFANELVTIINKNHGQDIVQNPTEWAVITPQYSSIPPSILTVSGNVAQSLKTPLIHGRTTVKGSRVVIYAQLHEAELRMANKLKSPIIIDPDSVYRKNILFIDDLSVTKTTISYITERLLQQYSAREVFNYLIVDLKTPNPEREEWINTFLLRTDPPKVTAILNAPYTVINRKTITSIMAAENSIFTSIINSLDQLALQKYYDAVLTYYENDVPFKENFQFLQSKFNNNHQ